MTLPDFRASPMTREQFDRFRLKVSKKARTSPSGDPEGDQSPAPVARHPEPQLPQLPQLPPLYDWQPIRISSPDASSHPVSERTLTMPDRPVRQLPVPSERRSKRTRTRRRSQGSSAGWYWLLALLLSGGAMMGAAAWLMSLPPAPDCQSPDHLSQVEQLRCIQQAIPAGNLEDVLAGLRLISSWSETDPLYEETQRLMRQWSGKVLETAQQRADSGEITSAISLASQVPTLSPLYGKVQKQVGLWKKDLQQGQKLYDQAVVALKAQKWDQVAEAIDQLSSLQSEYWQVRIQDLKNQLAIERSSRQQLRKARELALSNHPEDVVQALTLLQSINPASLARIEAEPDMERWSQRILDLATVRLQQGDTTGAIALARRIPSSSHLSDMAQDLLQSYQPEAARPIRITPGQSPLMQWWNLWQKLTEARQFTPEHPRYAQVQGLIPRWEQQLEELGQLQLANILAEIGQRSSLELAIAQAQAVAEEYPNSWQARSLVEYWQQQLQQVDDRPFLVKAQQLAAKGTPDSLKAAIVQAGKVAPGRSLRGEAQGLIAKWNRRVQILEDQPLLSRAIALEKQGKLGQALDLAAKIKPERALYPRAQTLIAQWTAPISKPAQQRRDRQRRFR